MHQDWFWRTPGHSITNMIWPDNMITSCWRTGSCPRRRGGPAPAPSCPRSPHCPPAPPRGTPPPDHRHSFNYINGYNCQSHLNKKLTQVLDLFHEKYNLLHPKDHQLLKGGFKSHLNKMTSISRILKTFSCRFVAKLLVMLLLSCGKYSNTAIQQNILQIKQRKT